MTKILSKRKIIYIYITGADRQVLKLKSIIPISKYIIYADTTVDSDVPITAKLVKKLGTRNAIRYYAKSIWWNRKKLTLKRIYI